MARVRERIDLGQIKAPVSGRITKRFCLTGEAVKENETVLEILEDNSIEAILYVPQKLTDEFEVGKDVQILLDPYQYPLTCTVRRLGDRFEPAPRSIARYYQSNQYLLPVYLIPHSEFSQLMAMRIHGTVKRPYEWKKSLQKNWETLKSTFVLERQSEPASQVSTPDTVNGIRSEHTSHPTMLADPVVVADPGQAGSLAVPTDRTTHENKIEVPRDPPQPENSMEFHLSALEDSPTT